MHTAEGQLPRAKKKMEEAVGREAVHKRSRMWKRGVQRAGNKAEREDVRWRIIRGVRG